MLLEADEIFPQIVMAVEDSRVDGTATQTDDVEAIPDGPTKPADDEVAALNLDSGPVNTEHESAESKSPTRSVEGTNATAAGAAKPRAFAGRTSRLLVIGTVVAFFLLAAFSFLLLRSRAGA